MKLFVYYFCRAVCNETSLVEFFYFDAIVWLWIIYSLFLRKKHYFSIRYNEEVLTVLIKKNCFIYWLFRIDSGSIFFLEHIVVRFASILKGIESKNVLAIITSSINYGPTSQYWVSVLSNQYLKFTNNSLLILVTTIFLLLFWIYE